MSITEAGGNIQEYKLYRNDNLIYHSYFNDSGYETIDVLPTFYYDTNLDLDLYYSYQIEYKTETGSIKSDTFTYNMYNWMPDNITDLKIKEFIIHENINLDIKISFKSLTVGVPYQHYYNILHDGKIYQDNSI